jgi:hypothetical protein
MELQCHELLCPSNEILRFTTLRMETPKVVVANFVLRHKGVVNVNVSWTRRFVESDVNHMTMKVCLQAISQIHPYQQHNYNNNYSLKNIRHILDLKVPIRAIPIR